jgi:hypothetical protein
VILTPACHTLLSYHFRGCIIIPKFLSHNKKEYDAKVKAQNSKYPAGVELLYW